MKKAGMFVAVVLVGVLSVGLSEFIMIRWLMASPWEVSGQFMLLGIVPVQLVVVGIASMVLFFIMRHNLALYMGVYWATFVMMHGLELDFLGNPVSDIAKYWVGITGACLVWFFVLRGIFSRR